MSAAQLWVVIGCLLAVLVVVPVVAMRMCQRQLISQLNKLAGKAQAKRELMLLFRECDFLINQKRDDAGGLKIARETLTAATRLTSGDHWAVGYGLAWLSYAEMCAEQWSAALPHLEASAAIFSEWPEQERSVKALLLSRIRFCRRRLELER